MNAEQALLEAYQEWCRLAKAATGAIHTGNYNLLTECQARILGYQPEITRLTGEVLEEWKQSKVDYMAKEEQLREIVSGLMDLTRENMNLIHQRRESARAKLSECVDIGRNLKCLQTYAHTQHPRWNSFS